MGKKLEWDKTGEKTYETGVNECVLYPVTSGKYSKGVAWNGITGVTESPSGAEATDLYADNIKYLTLRSAETFGATITAYMYPDEFKACNGESEISEGITIGQQARQAFGLSYKTLVGNDTDGENYGYKYHIIYGATASVSERNYATVNDSPEAIEFSWEITTTPVNVENGKPTASVVIDSTKFKDASKLEMLEAVLHGTDDQQVVADITAKIPTYTGDAMLPTPDELVALMAA